MFKIGDEVEVVYENKKGVVIGDKNNAYGAKNVLYKFIVKKENGEIKSYREDHLKPLTPKPFTKEDLQDGDIVITKDGRKLIVFNGFLLNISFDWALKDFANDLTEIYGNKDWDIMQVTRNGEVVYKREEKPTDEEFNDLCTQLSHLLDDFCYNGDLEKIKLMKKYINEYLGKYEVK